MARQVASRSSRMTPGTGASSRPRPSRLHVRARDAANNLSLPARYSWRIDLSTPDTTIVSGPPAQTTSTSATFSFTATEATVTFECSRDGAAFTSCGTPVTFEALAPGPHELQVRARDFVDHVDATPALHAWTIIP